MADISKAKWQDQARTTIIATINEQEYSGITPKSRFWSKVQDSGITIGPPDPPPIPDVAPLTAEELYDMLTAKIPPILTATDRPRPKPGGP